MLGDQESSNASWMFVKAMVLELPALSALAHSAPPRVSGYNAQGVANTERYFCTAAVVGEAASGEVLPITVPLREAQPQEPSNGGQCSSTTPRCGRCSMEVVGGKRVPRVLEFTPQNVGNASQ